LPDRCQVYLIGQACNRNLEGLIVNLIPGLVSCSFLLKMPFLDFEITDQSMA